MHDLSYEKIIIIEKYLGIMIKEYETPYFVIIEQLYQDGGNEMNISVNNHIEKVENLQQNSGNATGYQYNKNISKQQEIDELIFNLKNIAEKPDKDNKSELLDYIDGFSDDLKSISLRKSGIKSTCFL